MFEFKITCDFCGKEIKGEYRKIKQEFTDEDTQGVRLPYNDMCMDCLKMITDYKRIPLLEFPNTEAKDHE